MAESVDALVSNTSGATRAGSTPALGTLSTKLSKSKVLQAHRLQHFFILKLEIYHERAAKHEVVHVLLGATFGYSNHTKKCYFFINLGYEF